MATMQKQAFDIEYEFDLLGRKIFCTDEENQMFKKNGKTPDDVFYDISEQKYYRLENYPLNEKNKEDTKYFLMLQRTKYLKTIKNCVVFFTAATVIGIVIYIFSLLSHM